MDIRLTFQFSIENEQDQIEVFLIKKDGIQISSIGQWKALTNKNTFENIESLWQQANITFKAAEKFRVFYFKNRNWNFSFLFPRSKSKFDIYLIGKSIRPHGLLSMIF